MTALWQSVTRDHYGRTRRSATLWWSPTSFMLGVQVDRFRHETDVTVCVGPLTFGCWWWRRR